MCELIINGGNRLCGEVKIQGSKKRVTADSGGNTVDGRKMCDT